MAPLVMLSTEDLESRFGSAATLPILMMRPPACMCLAAAWVPTKTRTDVDREHVVEIFQREFIEWGEHQDAGIVDEDVERRQVR